MERTDSHPLARRLQVQERGTWRTVQLPPEEIFVARVGESLAARPPNHPDVVVCLRPTLEGILVTPLSAVKSIFRAISTVQDPSGVITAMEITTRTAIELVAVAAIS